MFDLQLVLVAVCGITFLLFSVIYLRIPAFIALLIASFAVGLGAGMPMENIIVSIKSGMGGTLGFVAVVVGLGAILGQILEGSGAIESIANTLIRKFGENNIQWSLGATGFLVAIPVFFDVAFIILAPLIYGLASKSKKSLLFYAVPLLAGLAITHSFIPPTPGPIAVAELIKANLGWVILFGVIVGFPAMVISGPLFGRFIAKRLYVPVPQTYNSTQLDTNRSLNIYMVMAIVLLPLLLIMLGTIGPFVLSEKSSVLPLLLFIGHPFVALSLTTILAMLFAFYFCGFSKSKLLDLANKGLEPAGIIILITGAGGAFKQLLVDSGVGQMLGQVMAQSHMPIILLAFLIAAITRVAQGSATVAMITAAGLIAPILDLQPLSDAYLGLLVIAISSGATILSHVNDSGFWLVSKYLGMSEKDTLRSWTVLSTIISLVGLLGCLIISLFL